MTGASPPPGTPAGDPMTGASPPPTLGLAYDPTELSRRLAQTEPTDEKDRWDLNPFLQMGLGILSNTGKSNALAGIAGGVQQGLTAYQGAKDNEATRRSKELDQFLYGSQLAQGWASQMRNRGELTAWQAAQLAQREQAGELQTFYDPQTDEFHTGVQKPGSTTLTTTDGEVDVSGMPPVKGPIKGDSGKGGTKEIQNKLAELEGFTGTINQLEGLAFGRVDPTTGTKTPGAFTEEPGLFGAVKYNDEGVLDRAATGLANLWNAAAQPAGKTTAMEYQRIIKSMSPEIARLFGHTGVLSDKDIVLTLEGLPKADGYPDTAEVARKFFAEIRMKLDRKRAELQAAMGDDGTTPPTTGAMAMPPSAGGSRLGELDSAAADAVERRLDEALKTKGLQ